MATITTRAGKGSPLTNSEVDSNFTNINTELGQKESASNKGVANGYASLDGSGKVPSTQLPSYVDDVVEGANLAALPGTGETGKIYVTLDTNKTYRWSGSAYVEISASPGSTDAVPEGSTNLYFSNTRARSAISATGSLSYNSSTGVMSFSDAVTSVAGRTGAVTLTSSDVGLGNVENKSSSTIRGEITSGNVTTALGYTPYNSTNPSGYITSSALSSYLPLSGGTLSGALSWSGGTSINDYTGTYGSLQITGGNGSFDGVVFPTYTNTPTVMFDNAGGGLYYQGNSVWGFYYSRANGTLHVGSSSTNQVLHAGNYTSYSPSLTGSGASGTWGISITGSAGSVGWANITAGTRTGHGDLRFQPPASSFAGLQFLDSGGIGAGWLLIRATSDTDVYTAEGITLVADKGWLTLAQRDTAGKGVRIMSGTTSTERIKVTTAGDIQLVNGNSFTYNGNAVLHAANYSSYALPLSGGTLTGTLNINANDGLKVTYPVNDGDTWYRGWGVESNRGAVYLRPTSNASQTLRIGYSEGNQNWNVVRVDASSFTQNGSQVLHAGNYTSYSPSLTGSGASGTWGISITGDAPRSGSVYGTGYGVDRFTWHQESGTFAGQSGWASYLISNHGDGNTYYSQTLIMPFWGPPQYSRKQGSSSVVGPYTFITTENYNNYSYAKLQATRYVNTDFNSLGNEANGFRAYSNYIPSGGSYNQPPNGAGDYRVYQLSSPETAGNWGGQIVQNFYDDRMWFRRQQGSAWQSWREFIHDGNYGSYALPLSGGTVSGVVRINNQLQVGQNTNGTAWIDAYGGYAWFGRDSNTTGVRIDGSGNVHTTAALNSVGALTQNGNQVLHAGNYTSYSPSLTGSGASGTWGINITGNAGSVGGRAASYFYPNVTDNGYATGDIAGTTAHQRLWGTDSVQNMFAFNPPTEVEYSTNGSTWTSTTCPADVWDGKVYGKWGGMGMSVGNNIGGWRYVRMTWRNFGYRFFSHFTLAHTTNGHSFNFVFYKSDLSGNFGGEAFRMNNIGSWPGYTFVKHENVSGWWDTRDIRIVFELNHNNDYANNAIAVGHIGLMGSYGGFQRLYDWNSDRSMYFKNAYITDSSHQVLHAGNYSSYALPLSGGTVEGTANVRTSVIKQYQYVRHIEGKNWDTYDTSASGLYLQYASNQPVYIGSASNVALHSGNYSSYSPTLTGGGASGTWGINITGNAASVTNGVTSGNVASFAIPASTNFGSGDLNQAYNSGLYGFDVPSNSPGFSYGHILVMRGRGDTIAQLAIDYSTGQASFRGGYLPNGSSTVGAVWSSWRRAIDSANYSSYALPLSGGTITGTLTFANNFLRIASDNSDWGSGNYFRGTNNHFVLGVQSGGTLYLNYGNSAGTCRIEGTTLINGNTALHAANYTSYSPSLTGSGASGTWGINVTGESRSVNLGGTGHTITSSSWAGGGGYHGYTYVGGNFRFGFSSTGGVVDVYADGNFYATDSSHLVLHTGNYTSYTGGLSSTNNWGGVNYFVANRNTDSNSPPLQAFSNNGSGAIMSFHRGGYYAVNFGLDSDNVIRIGGWSASANRWQLDMSGNGTYAGNVTAYSDERLKKDWSPIYDGFVDRLAVIRAGTYTRIDSGERQAGVSAQAMRELLPEVVSEDNEGTLALAYGNAAMVSAVELAKELVQLKRELAELKSKLH